ncbi:MAG: flagellar biosynthesis protein FlhG [Thiomicrorhabdus sp.]|nr:MAG: flagellar biosynthesis protein FlhG [Thiomicrorhabdus sp.]
MLNDQAAGLRAMQSNPTSVGGGQQPVRVIAVASGKGGVGKTNVSVNLGVSLSKMGSRVLLMDADMGLANVDIMLGIQTPYNLVHVLDGQKTLEEVIVEGPGGLKIIPAASGISRMAQLTAMENAGIINAFSELNGKLDILIVDTAAGIADSVISFCRAAQEVVIVVTDEPASITDAYALIKVLSRDFKLTRFRLLANQSRSPEHGRLLYEKLARVCEQFLDVSLDYFGTVPFDHDLREAVQKQVPVTIYKPHSESAKAFKKMAQKVDSWPIPKGVTGYLQFFVENLFQSGH